MLVCDDEETVRLVCERSLSRAGYDAHVFARGADAVAAARRESFDVFVLDVRMPDMSGPRVLAALRAFDPDAPCLVISGYADFEAAVELLRQGATDFLRKPFDVADFVVAVDRVLAGAHLKVDRAMLAATQTIVSSLELPAIVRRVLEVVEGSMHAHPALLVDEGDGAPRLYRPGEDEGEVLDAPAALPAATLERLYAARDAAILDADDAADVELARALAPGARQVVVQPLVVADHGVGLLVAGRRADERTFGDADLRRAALLAGHAALALENGRLHHATLATARQLEDALDRLVVAERIATVARLASGLGHEIANPTTAVLAHLELAGELIDAGRAGDARDALERARAGARQILDICGALRPFGQRGRVVQHIDLRQVVDGALLLVAHELRGRAKVVVEPPAREPLVFADPSKLGQVFLNLLLNAAQAIAPGDAVANQVRIAFETRGDRVLVRVRDTGCGVPPELVEHIFEPSITTKATGRGMGLAICRWILEEMGGAIRCIPQAPPERGTTFEVELPKEARATSPGTPAASG